MAISIDDIKKLRAMTGAGLADVKKALTEAEGDFEKAKRLRSSSVSVASLSLLSVATVRLQMVVYS